MAYHYNASNSCCFSSLASAFTALVEKNAARDIVMLIEESLHCKYQGHKDRFSFANGIMSDQVKNQGEQRLHYNIKKLKKGQFDIIHDIIEIFPWYSKCTELEMSIIQ